MNIPSTVLTLVALMGLDIATGILSAFVQGRISSDASRRGLSKKALMLLLIAAVHVGGESLGVNDKLSAAGQAVGVNLELAGITAIGFCVNEFISIVENVGNAGVPIPKALVDWMSKFEKLAPVVLDQKTTNKED